jgi:hypothetical protein
MRLPTFTGSIMVQKKKKEKAKGVARIELESVHQPKGNLLSIVFQLIIHKSRDNPRQKKYFYKYIKHRQV